MTSNRPLNSNDALEESTATNSSVMLSGIRREKVAPGFLDIEEPTTNSQNSDRGGGQKAGVRDQRSEVRGQKCRSEHFTGDRANTESKRL